jgi:E3 ubiquitin-protein ligase MARCH6
MEIIGPVTGGLTLLLFVPAAIVWGLRNIFSLPIDSKFLCEQCPRNEYHRKLKFLLVSVVHVYPGLFAVVGFGRSIMVGLTLLSSWSQSIRDKEFLVEMRLRNHEPADEEKNAVDVAKDADAELSDN